MLIATAQMPMKSTVEANLETTLRYIEVAARLGANMVLFPELSLPGFHRGIVQETAKLANDESYLLAICHACRELAVHAWVGLPDVRGESRFNSYMLIDPNGTCLSTIDKIGLTESECTFFQCGTARPITMVGTLRVGVVMCREVADLEAVCAQLEDANPDMLVWPACIGDPPTGPSENPEGTNEQASEIARSLACPIVQCNWANALNTPDAKGLGGSSLIGRNGEEIWSCPHDKPGFALIDIESGSCTWEPCPL